MPIGGIAGGLPRGGGLEYLASVAQACRRAEAWLRVRGYISTVAKHGDDVLTASPRPP